MGDDGKEINNSVSIIVSIRTRVNQLNDYKEKVNTGNAINDKINSQVRLITGLHLDIKKSYSSTNADEKIETKKSSVTDNTTDAHEKVWELIETAGRFFNTYKDYTPSISESERPTEYSEVVNSSAYKELQELKKLSYNEGTRRIE